MQKFLILLKDKREGELTHELICETKNEAQKLVESDPFIKKGYYASYEVHEIIEANEGNNWLFDDPQTKSNLLNQ